MKIVELTGTTTGGALTVTASESVVGYIEKVVYDHTEGAEGGLVLTAEAEVSEPILTDSAIGILDTTWYPRSLANKVADGSAFTDFAIKMFVTAKMKAVVSTDTVAIANIDGDATTITVDTAAPHLLLAGDRVTIAGTVNYNGTFTVATKTDADTFTIASTSHDLAAEVTGTMLKDEVVHRYLVYVSDE